MLLFLIFVSSDVSLVDEVENEENTVHASAGFCDPDGDDMELQLLNDEGDEAIAIAKYCHENQWTPNLNGPIDFQGGQIFGNAKLLRKVVKQYAIQEGFMLTKIKNDRSRYTIKCKNETCDWRFHASCLPDGLTFMIRSEANSKWVSEVVGTAIMANPTILPKVLKTELQEKYAIKCDSQTIYRAKKRVLKNLKVDHVNSYAKIRQYTNIVYSINQGTVAKVMVDHSFGHIVVNFRATFKNLNMTGKLWAASRVGYAAGFKEVIESIKNDSVKEYNYLMKAGPDKWARHTFDPRIKFDHNTNNMSECFNSWIKDDRDKPILTLMESLRRKVMVRFHEKWEEVEKFEDGISPYVRGRINDNDKEGKKLHVFHGRSEYHETIDKKMVVNLKEKTCNCKLLEISRIPCEHALAAFSFNRQFAHESVHWYYSNEALKLTYGGNINPTKKNRRREADEGPAPSKKISANCRNCGGLEHNKRTCNIAGTSQRKSTQTTKQPRLVLQFHACCFLFCLRVFRTFNIWCKFVKFYLFKG
ncbi:hypothetical protein ACOSQ2_026758 [Xanthoceras sorbifolium]